MLDINLLNSPQPDLVSTILFEFHTSGPVNSDHLETLSYLKKFQPDFFSHYEQRIMFLMGLFYKAGEPKTLFEKIYKIYAESIQEDTHRSFTPIQADAFKSIQKYDNFSFSAPTSAGKSFVYQELLLDIDGDIIIVVPSRALLSEYIIKVSRIVPNEVLVLPFIELVNTKKTTRRIYIITPERGDELFKFEGQVNIKLFLFDEAQLSEEGIRGMKFDSFVRRVDKHFPGAKKVFTHPFVINPEAQIKKHDLKNGNATTYEQKTVGKIYLEHYRRKFKYFSPFADNTEGNIVFEGDIIEETLAANKTALVYISKQKIYSGEFTDIYAKYLRLCPKVKNEVALSYIEELSDYIGNGGEKKSLMITLMRMGVVIHHGSMPLKARLIIEKFVNEGFAKLCFSTSTLIQGINMPFDLVWINNFNFKGNTEDQRRLNLKNLIGRAGRSTKAQNHFDYGYVVVETKNKATFIDRLIHDSKISEVSLLDQNSDEVQEDFKDIVTAIKDDTFNNELNLTDLQVERIEQADLDTEIKYILDNLLSDGVPLTGTAYYNLGDVKRSKLKKSFQTIYTAHLRRREMTRGEKNVLSTAIPILLWQIQGKSFSEIVSLRYSFLSERDFRRKLRRSFKNGDLTAEDYYKQLQDKTVRFTCMAEPLPKKTYSIPQPLFRNTSIIDLDFDTLIYDTYDYIDKVISLSLKDPLSAAFTLYYSKHNDERALTISNLIRFGTDDQMEIWLQKYGFTFDEIEWITPHVEQVNSEEIIFKNSIFEEIDNDSRKKDVVVRYL